MNKSEVSCPVCGSCDIARSEENRRETIPFGPDFVFSAVNYRCNVCGEEGDFFSENEERFLVQQKSALTVSVKQLVEKLSSENNITQAYLERSFELPFRTVARWKNGDFSSAVVAFLRTVATYPWLVTVAEAKFDSGFARSVLLKEAGNVLLDEVKSRPGTDLSFTFEKGVSGGITTFTATASVQIPSENLGRLPKIHALTVGTQTCGISSGA